VQQPKSLVNGAVLDVTGALSWRNRKEFHHIFPKAYLASRPDSERQMQNAVGNICLLASDANKTISSKPPSDYMGTLRAQHGERFDSILASNLIPPLADSGILESEYEYFLHARCEI